jgi:hypothetical protein
MDFSVSVHNATAGLLSIAKADRSPATAVAGGRESLSAALLEAQALVEEGAERVLAIYHDETPPAVLDGHWDREASGWALALLLTRDKGRTLSMRLDDDPSAQGGDQEPQGLALARLLALGRGSQTWSEGRHAWTWSFPL